MAGGVRFNVETHFVDSGTEAAAQQLDAVAVAADKASKKEKELKQSSEKANRELNSKELEKAAAKMRAWITQAQNSIRMMKEWNVTGPVASRVARTFGNNIDFSDQQLKEYAQTLNRTLSEQKALSSSMKTGSGFVASLKSQLKSLVLQYVALAAAIMAARRAFDFWYESTTKIEGGVISVVKTTDLAGKELEKFKAGIRGLATKDAPELTQSLFEAAAAAGQMGLKTSKAVLDVTRVSAYLQSATDVMGNDAAKSLVRLLNLQGEYVDSVENAASALVDLGNNIKGTESEILSIANSVGRGTALYDIGTANVLGYAAALVEAGERSEASGTVIQKMLNKIQIGVSTGNKDLANFAKVSGMSADAFAKLARSDINQAFLAFLTGLSKHGTDAAGVLVDMNIKEARMTRVTIELADQIENLKDRLARSNQAFSEGSAARKEAEAAYSSLSSRVTAFKNSLEFLVGVSDDNNTALKEWIDAQTAYVVALSDSDTASKKFAAFLADVLFTAIKLIVEALKLLIDNLLEITLLLVAIKYQAIATGLSSIAASIGGLTLSVEALTVAALANPILAGGVAILGALLLLNKGITSWADSFAEQTRRIIETSKELMDVSDQVQRAIASQSSAIIQASKSANEALLSDAEANLLSAKKVLDDAKKAQDDFWNPESSEQKSARVEKAQEAFDELSQKVVFYKRQLQLLENAEKKSAGADEMRQKLKTLRAQIDETTDSLKSLGTESEKKKQIKAEIKLNAEIEKFTTELFDKVQDSVYGIAKNTKITIPESLAIEWKVEIPFEKNIIADFARSAQQALDAAQLQIDAMASIVIDESVLPEIAVAVENVFEEMNSAIRNAISSGATSAEVASLIEDLKRKFGVELGAAVNDALEKIGSKTVGLKRKSEETVGEIQYLMNNLDKLGLKASQVADAVREGVFPDLFSIGESLAELVGSESDLIVFQQKSKDLALSLERIRFELLVKQLEAAGLMDAAMQGVVDKIRSLFQQAASQSFGGIRAPSLSGYFSAFASGLEGINEPLARTLSTLGQGAEAFEIYRAEMKGVEKGTTEAKAAMDRFGSAISGMVAQLVVQFATPILAGGGTSQFGGQMGGSYAAEGAQIGGQLAGPWGAFAGMVVGAFFEKASDRMELEFRGAKDGINAAILRADGELAGVANDIVSSIESFYKTLTQQLGGLNLDIGDVDISIDENLVTVIVDGYKQVFRSLDEALAWSAEQVLYANRNAEGLGDNMRQLFANIDPKKASGSFQDLADAIDLARRMDDGLAGSLQYLTDQREREMNLARQYGLDQRRVLELARERMQQVRDEIELSALQFAGGSSIVANYKELVDRMAAYDDAIGREKIAMESRQKAILEEIDAIQKRGEGLGLEGGVVTNEQIMEWRRQAKESGQTFEEFTRSLGENEQAAIKDYEMLQRLQEEYAALAEQLGMLPEEFTEAYKKMLQDVARFQSSIGFFNEILDFQNKYGANIVNEQALKQQIAEMEFKMAQIRIQLLVLELIKNQELLGLTNAQINQWKAWADQIAGLEFTGVSSSTGRGGGRRQSTRQAADDFRSLSEDMARALSGMSSSVSSYLDNVQRLNDLAEKGKIPLEELNASLADLASLYLADISKPFSEFILSAGETDLQTSLRQAQERYQQAINDAFVAAAENPEAYAEAARIISEGSAAEIASILDDAFLGLGGITSGIQASTAESIANIQLLIDHASEFGRTVEDISLAVLEANLPALLDIMEAEAERVGDEEFILELQKRREEFERNIARIQFESMVAILEAAGAIDDELRGFIDRTRGMFDEPIVNETNKIAAAARNAAQDFIKANSGQLQGFRQFLDIQETVDKLMEDLSDIEDPMEAMNLAKGIITAQWNATIDAIGTFFNNLTSLGIKLPDEAVKALALAQLYQAKTAFLAAIGTKEFADALAKLGIDVPEFVNNVMGQFDNLELDIIAGTSQQEQQKQRVRYTDPVTGKTFLVAPGEGANDNVDNTLERLRQQLKDIARQAQLANMDPLAKSLAEIGDKWRDFMDQLIAAKGTIEDMAEAERLFAMERERAIGDYIDKVRDMFSRVEESINRSLQPSGSLAGFAGARSAFREAQAAFLATPQSEEAARRASEAAQAFFDAAQSAGVGTRSGALRELQPFFDLVKSSGFDESVRKSQEIAADARNDKLVNAIKSSEDRLANIEGLMIKNNNHLRTVVSELKAA